MVEDDTARSTLKTELFRRVDALGVQQALYPSQEERIDELVQQLERINPIPHPLQPNHLHNLLGDWELVYASRGTVVTRRLASIPDFLAGIKTKRVWQTLATGNTQKIVAENGAKFDLPLLGEWQLRAEGVWKWGADEQVATVTFNAFSVQVTKLFDQSSLSLPELKILVLEFLRNEALWSTSYLDEEMRVGRGATGNLFVFRRSQTV